jgi:hypothetical protein
VGACSSKAIYRLADKMGLEELKERAYEHIVKSLTAQNVRSVSFSPLSIAPSLLPPLSQIVYEVFGSFSQRFDEIRQVEIAFLLEKWVRFFPFFCFILRRSLAYCMPISPNLYPRNARTDRSPPCRTTSALRLKCAKSSTTFALVVSPASKRYGLSSCRILR